MASTVLSLLIVGVVLALYVLPKLQVRGVSDPEKRATQENESRRTLAQIIGALAVIGGFYFTWQQLASSQRTASISERSQISDRINKAARQLEDPGPTVRVAGVYALDRIANESPRDADGIAAMLCAYIRQHRPVSSPRPDAALEPKTRPVLQAIIDVLDRRRSVRSVNASIDLSDSALAGLNFGGKDFSGADLTQSDLSRADLRWTEFGGASLYHAVLRDSDMHSTFLETADLRGADLTGARVDESHWAFADLRGAKFVRLRQWEGMHDMTMANLFDATFDNPTVREHFVGRLGAVVIESWDAWEERREADERYIELDRERKSPVPRVPYSRWK